MQHGSDDHHADRFTSSAADAPHPHIDLILQQLDALPTLSAVAVRVLELTSDEQFRADDVIELISSDPSLSAKVLKLCRCSEQGRAANVRTVDRAILMLGFRAVRNAVLSVQVFDTLEQLGRPAPDGPEPRAGFDRRAFWQHSIAVAVAAEALASQPSMRSRINRSEAFIAGLLHELGLLALHVTLETALDDACRYAEQNAVGIDHACRRVVGIDSRTAGKRLAEHWRLPHALIDVVWLHGQPPQLVPELEHRDLINLVSLADAVVHCRYIAPVDHGRRCAATEPLQQTLGIDDSAIENVISALPDEVQRRAEALGLTVEHNATELLRALSRANAALGRINDHLHGTAALSEHQARTIEAISVFHRRASPGGSVLDALTAVARSASSVFDSRQTALLFQPAHRTAWNVMEFENDGQMISSRTVRPPEGYANLDEFDCDTDVPIRAVDLTRWLHEALPELNEDAAWRLLPLRCGSLVHAAVVYAWPGDQDTMERAQLEALARTWAAAVMASVQHEGAKRLGEQLAEANAILSETQDELTRARSLAAVGEVAAGAAHEMNNPLTVISGRAQILASRIDDDHQRAMAGQIAEASHRLSGMITALRRFTEPIRLNRTTVSVSQLLDVAIEQAEQAAGRSLPVDRQLPAEEALAHVWVDGAQFADAIAELVRNALESEKVTRLTVRVQIDPHDDRLIIMVQDDGQGLSDHVLAHAFEPFFSAKPAGRQPGLGLARARRIVEAHRGLLTLRNVPGHEGGAIATIGLTDWRADQSQRHVA